MEIFLSRLVFQIQHASNTEHIQFDEVVYLIKARDFSQAIDNADHIGQTKQIQLTDLRGKSVNWVYVGIAQIEHAEVFEHGSELYSHIWIQENASEYVHYIRTMHENMRAFHFKEELTL